MLPNHRQIRFYLLLELMIALGLTAILLTVLFRFFAQSVLVDQKVERAKIAMYQRQHLQTRLSSILSSIAPRSLQSTSTMPSLFTPDSGHTSIIATFDQGIDPNPLFSGPTIGQIHIDERKNLILTLWPLEKTEKDYFRSELLLSNVEGMRWQFLAKKDALYPDDQAVTITPTLQWRSFWPKNCYTIPSIVRLFIRQEGRELSFAFMLPITEPVITYQRGVG